MIKLILELKKSNPHDLNSHIAPYDLLLLENILHATNYMTIKAPTLLGDFS